MGFGLLMASSGCGRDETGAHVFVHVGSLQFDELRIGVRRADTAEVVVDPVTAGRYLGPFKPGDQDVIIYLPDALDGTPMLCEATALQGGVAASFGTGNLTVARGVIKDVKIFMAAPPNSPGMPPPDVPPPGMPLPGRSNGDSCSLGTECVTGQCVDGVCCESECRTECRSCALPDAKGLCRPVPGGTPDPRGMCKDEGVASCQGNGLCDASGRCAEYPAGTICEPAKCNGNSEVTQARMCNGGGNCENGEKLKCAEGSSCVAGVCT